MSHLIAKIKAIPVVLTDKNGEKLNLGDTVTMTRSCGRAWKDRELVLVFNVPQHRFGFEYQSNIDKSEHFIDDFITKYPSCAIYLTPKNCSHMIKKEI